LCVNECVFMVFSNKKFGQTQCCGFGPDSQSTWTLRICSDVSILGFHFAQAQGRWFHDRLSPIGSTLPCAVRWIGERDSPLLGFRRFCRLGFGWKSWTTPAELGAGQRRRSIRCFREPLRSAGAFCQLCQLLPGRSCRNRIEALPLPKCHMCAFSPLYSPTRLSAFGECRPYVMATTASSRRGTAEGKAEKECLVTPPGSFNKH
jgi:hypothetical protein